MIQPVVLCGGIGTRLWPSSRPTLPKQFAQLLPDQSLYQATLQRVAGSDFAAPLVMTSDQSRFLAAEQAHAAGITPSQIVLEPTPCGTAPAVLTATLMMEMHPEMLMLVAPSDHVISDIPNFLAAIQLAKTAAQQGSIIAFGVSPDRAETGYGYLELPADDAPDGASPVTRFVEKPGAKDAERMSNSGHHHWNAGLYLFRVCDFLRTCEQCAPDLLAPCRSALAAGHHDLDFLRLGSAYSDIDPISLDHAVMEKAIGLQSVPLSAGWHDLGSWAGLKQASSAHASDMVQHGSVTALDCQDTLLWSEDEAVHLVGIGLDGIAAISTRDAVLVTDLRSSQNVGQAVALLAERGISQAHQHPRCHRPWGWFESLCLGDRFQVKRIKVNPGGILSLQSHIHRAEHWVVVAGTARVTVGNEVRLLSENESLYVPLGAMHRLENPGKLPVYLIEIQTGAYLGEDDITRYSDAYHRCVAE